MRRPMRVEILGLCVAVAMLAGGCELFGNDDGDELGDDESGDDNSETTGEELAPSRGFRVYPKYMRKEVPAIVTIELDGISPAACELDGDAAGGYLCDADELQNGSLATIMVERDGFDMAIRHPEVPFNQIIPLEVHLAVEGGPTGSWSPCTVAGEFETCDDLCGTFAGTCAVTSCATDDPEWPLASMQTFLDSECVEQVESLASACEEPLLGAAVTAGLRCCCAS